MVQFDDRIVIVLCATDQQTEGDTSGTLSDELRKLAAPFKDMGIHFMIARPELVEISGNRNAPAADFGHEAYLAEETAKQTHRK